ncbi:MAG: AI-2E family transporter [Pelosinus sp.]|nr:AI-2E family transporter [Pelosinus sp.]
MYVTKKSIRLVLLVILICAAGYFLWLVRKGLYPFIIGFILAYILNPAVCFFEGKGIKRGWSIMLVYCLLAVFLLFIASQVVPLLLRELEGFARDLPQISNKMELSIQNFQLQYENLALPAVLREAADGHLIELQEYIVAAIGGFMQNLIELCSYAIGLAISPILAFYLLQDWYRLKEQILLILPGKFRTEVVLSGKDIDKVLSGVIRGQVIVSLLVGTLVTAGLYFMKVKYAFLIGIMAGILDFIPYFGAIIGAAPAVGLALVDSPWLAVKVLILFFVVHQLEGSIIHPQIVGENVGLHPLTVIFFVFVGGEIAGLPGMLLGVPLAGMAKVIGQHILRLLM